MYAKVFAQIYDGTLCTKGPWEALVTFQQLLVLADQDGNVDMTMSAISRRTTIPMEIIETGIAALLLPDPESRTPTEEGRRILPLSEGRAWGWRVVNYAHYRQLKREDDRRAYHREYWHKRKDKLNASTVPQHTQPSQPIAEAYAEAEAIKPPAALKVSDGRFEAFWKAYPKKVGKKEAERKFVKIKPSAELLDSMLQSLSSQTSSEQWRKDNGQFIPDPAKWLHQGRWEDGGGIELPMKVVEVYKPEPSLNAEQLQANKQRATEAMAAIKINTFGNIARNKSPHGGIKE